LYNVNSFDEVFLNFFKKIDLVQRSGSRRGHPPM